MKNEYSEFASSLKNTTNLAAELAASTSKRRLSFIALLGVHDWLWGHNSCCDDQQRFLLHFGENPVSCHICQNSTRTLPCCRRFQPEFITTKGFFDCMSFKKILVEFRCNTVNINPGVPTNRRCSNPNCRYKIISCSCKTVLSSSLLEMPNALVLVEWNMSLI